MGKFKNCVHFFFKEKLVPTLIVSVLTIGVGIGAGIVINKFVIGSSAVDYSNIDENKYLYNEEELINKYQNTAFKSDYRKALTPGEMVSLSYALYKKHTNYRSISIGTVDAGVNQTIRASNMRDGTNYMEESISLSSMVGVALRSYQDENNVTSYFGDNIETDKANFNKEPKIFKFDEYKATYGSLLNNPQILLIHDKTIKESKVEKDANGYTLELVLNTKTAVVNYVRQMKNLSNLVYEPTFYELKATFKLDNSLLIKECSTYESYYAKKKLDNGLEFGTNCVGNLNIKYEVDGNFKIPSNLENVNYKGETL